MVVGRVQMTATASNVGPGRASDAGTPAGMSPSAARMRLQPAGETSAFGPLADRSRSGFRTAAVSELGSGRGAKLDRFARSRSPSVSHACSAPASR